jgi:hypothetical protein
VTAGCGLPFASLVGWWSRHAASSQSDDVAGLGPIDDAQDVARDSLTVAFVLLVAVMVMLAAMFAGGAG